MPQRWTPRALADGRNALDLIGHDRCDRAVDPPRADEVANERQTLRAPGRGVTERGADLFDVFAECPRHLHQAARRGVMAAIIAGCAMTAWLAGVAGLIGWVAAAGEFPWHFAALGAAVLHLLVAGIVVALLRRPSPPMFSISKAELLKDREWLLNLKDKPKP